MISIESALLADYVNDSLRSIYQKNLLEEGGI
jgi:hypothetical protein